MAKEGGLFSAGHVEGKMKVLIRGYKTYLVNKNKSGGKAKYFAYAEEMQLILVHSHDIILLHFAGTNIEPTMHRDAENNSHQKVSK